MPRNFFQHAKFPQHELDLGRVRANRLSLNPHVYHSHAKFAAITVVTNLEGVFNLETDVNCVFLGKDGDQSPSAEKRNSSMRQAAPELGP